MSTKSTTTDEVTNYDPVAEVLQKEISSLEFDVNYHREKLESSEVRLKVMRIALAKQLKS
tara:strand:- start:4570 stop:4749 length:180 start_codon:yes stop_codon:yes gene_type:complete